MKQASLRKDTFLLSLGQGGRLVIQALYFVLIARALGPASYGAFVAIIGMIGIVTPFAGFGSPNLFIKNVRSGKRSEKVCWGNGIVISCVSGAAFSLTIMLIGRIFKMPVSGLLLLAVAVSDLIFGRIADLASFGFAASHRMQDTALQGVVISLLRLIGIFVLSRMYTHVTYDQWLYTYIITGLVAGTYAVVRGTQIWGKPELDVSVMREDIVEGVYFSIGTSATTVYNDIDKVMLSRLSDLTSTGIYGAAYRIIDVAMTPARSLISAAFPRFFQHGIHGLERAYAFAKTLIRKSSLYGVGIFLGLIAFSGFIPYFLGARYAAVTPAVRLLAIIPLCRCIHAFLADALSGAGMQRSRVVIQVSVAAINFGLNLVILPRYSWRGAAWTSIISDVLLIVGFWSMIQFNLWRSATWSKGGAADA